MGKRSCGLDKRKCHRKPLGLHATLISSNATYDAVIVNISENGMCIRIPHVNNSHVLKSDTGITLNMITPSRTIINLNCRRKWSYKVTPASIIENIGLELVDPPEHYDDFCKLLPDE